MGRPAALALEPGARGPRVIAGHFGFAAGVKAKAKAVPLWALMLACQWLDVVFVPLLVAGVERLEPIAGARSGAYGEVIIHADYTHSIVGAVVLSLGFGAVAAVRYGRRSGGILALVALSHWVLDLIMHRGDMPILPGGIGGLPRLGFGLWRYRGPSAALELAFVVVGGALYWRAARRVAGRDGEHVRRANRCGAATIIAGAVTLGLNLAGL